MPVRIGVPQEIEGLKEYVMDPSYSTVVGLLHYGKQAKKQRDNEKLSKDSGPGIVTRLHAWLKGEF